MILIAWNVIGNLILIFLDIYFYVTIVPVNHFFILSVYLNITSVWILMLSKNDDIKVNIGIFLSITYYII